MNSIWKYCAMSSYAVRADKVVFTKLAAIHLFQPFLRGSGVSRKTERPYSAMKRWIPGIVRSILSVDLHGSHIYGN